MHDTKIAIKNGLTSNELKDFLDEKYDLFNRVSFIESDPIQIPHQFSLAEDIEIAAFLTSTIAWGNRKSIISNANRMMELLGRSPHDFIMNAKPAHFLAINNFVHRTFNSSDVQFFLFSLRNIYRKYLGLKSVFLENYSKTLSLRESLIHFRSVFLETEHLPRVEKHIADVISHSAAKRLNLFLMWMVRNDHRGVHFGLWNEISPAHLFMPLDVHSGNISRKLGLLLRKQNDWKAVEELTANLRKFDAYDPVKYDFALFGLGVFEHF